MSEVWDMNADRYNHIVKKTIEYRGVILHQMSHLEKAMDTYIANYLADKNETKVAELQLLIFGDNRMTLDSKKQVFHYIAKTHDEIWYSKYESQRGTERKKDNWPFNIDLDYVIKQRNIMAHCIPNTTKEAELNLDAVGFIRFKDYEQPFWYTHEQYIELQETIVFISKYIFERNQK